MGEVLGAFPDANNAITNRAKMARVSVKDTRHVSPLYKVINARISQSLAVERKDEIFDSVTSSEKPTKQQLLYMGVIAITRRVTTLTKVVPTITDYPDLCVIYVGWIPLHPTYSASFSSISFLYFNVCLQPYPK